MGFSLREYISDWWTLKQKGFLIKVLTVMLCLIDAKGYNLSQMLNSLGQVVFALLEYIYNMTAEFVNVSLFQQFDDFFYLWSLTKTINIIG